MRGIGILWSSDLNVNIIMFEPLDPLATITYSKEYYEDDGNRDHGQPDTRNDGSSSGSELKLDELINTAISSLVTQRSEFLNRFMRAVTHS